MMRSELLLITRVRTNNKGNQALSAAWVAILQQAFPGTPLRVHERRPHHLLQYTLACFANARDPFREFDRVTNQLAGLAPGADHIEPPREEPRIILDERIAKPIRFGALRQRLNLRRWAARAGRYTEAYRQRLAAIQRARLVVLNPAGEFFPEDPMPALYHLLDLFVAYKLGQPTAIVNHTLDVADPTLRRLIPRIYDRLALVGFRDEKSADAYRAMGGALHNVTVTPDLALTTPPPSPRPRTGRIAVALHAPAAAWNRHAEGWLDAIRGLHAAGFELSLVSNEVPSDQAFFSEVASRVPVRIEGVGLEYDRYCELLGSFDFLVSSRMHTSILALVAGTPVIPVESSSFKISGLFAELGIGGDVLQPTVPGWTARVVERATALRDRRAAAAAEVSVKIDAVRARIASSLIPRLRDAGDGR